MKTEPQRPHARDYIANLAATGRYHFASSDARDALGVSADAGISKSKGRHRDRLLQCFSIQEAILS